MPYSSPSTSRSVSGGVETMIGVSHDPAFGPLVAFITSLKTATAAADAEK